MKKMLAANTAMEPPPSLSIDELRENYLSWRKTKGYSRSTNEYDDIKWKYFLDYTDKHGVKDYTHQLGKDFLNFIQTRGYTKGYFVSFKKFIYRLDCIFLGEEILRTTPKEGIIIPERFYNEVHGFLQHCKNNGNKEHTVSEKARLITHFFKHLEVIGCSSISDLNAETVLKAASMGKQINSWAAIRQFLEYMYDTSQIHMNYAAVIPVKKRKDLLPVVYSKEEISLLENSFDRQTPLGKRDYAMVLLASRLKLRASDIVGLLLESIDFGADRITLNQKKRGITVRLPLLPECKEALQDYINNARPQSKEPYVFLRINAPYRPLTRTTMYDTVSLGFKKAGVDTSTRPSGPHALRSSGITHMVNSGVSYKNVKEAAGHTSREAIRHYARLDIEQLRKCAQNPPSVTDGSYFSRFLEGGEIV